MGQLLHGLVKGAIRFVSWLLLLFEMAVQKPAALLKIIKPFDKLVE